MSKVNQILVENIFVSVHEFLFANYLLFSLDSFLFLESSLFDFFEFFLLPLVLHCEPHPCILVVFSLELSLSPFFHLLVDFFAELLSLLHFFLF